MTMDQQRLFDGYSIEAEKGSVGGFDIDPDDIAHFRADEVLVLVMTGTVAGGSFKHTTGGDWVRTNKLVAHQVRVATGVMRDEIVEFYNLAGDELPYVAHRTHPQATPNSSPNGAVSTPVDPDLTDDSLVDTDA